MLGLISLPIMAMEIDEKELLKVDLFCSDSKIFLEIENVSEFIVPLDGRSIGLENDFRWNPFSIIAIDIYKAQFEFEGTKLHPPKKENIFKTDLGDYLITIAPFNKIKIELDVASEYVLDKGKTYVMSLFSMFHKVKINGEIVYINLNSSPIKIKENKCIGNFVE